VAGVTVTRADGSTCVVRLSAEVARPLLENFTPEQVQALVQAIAHSLDNPVDGPLCRRPD
jgi:plasmid stabilization system protein ParE